MIPSFLSDCRPFRIYFLKKSAKIAKNELSFRFKTPILKRCYKTIPFKENIQSFLKSQKHYSSIKKQVLAHDLFFVCHSIKPTLNEDFT